MRTGGGDRTGITLAKKFVELHWGKIWLDSEVGKGTTFTFTLPMSLTHSLSHRARVRNREKKIRISKFRNSKQTQNDDDTTTTMLQTRGIELSVWIFQILRFYLTAFVRISLFEFRI